ncbi:aldolase/citrate lyase family protein [Agriterribacter sp.]|uniref:HpcH/HpaI aldolase family protein n=1 Tax=Agriterribacter sp. TaxID=2821509 RepID=UPI002C3E6FD2|nr:aldolase/citrate lyase family protein [Agriterribacter sp.]HRO46146.1 aldolase/citrate lyase family protein [Agriterribacter sp.]HRQ16260.1 aldolase/citrate lyase family protein [Agriterribacter sp.]
MGMLEKLKNGQNVYGTCFTSTAPGWPLVFKKAGLDFAFIDTEHTALNRADMAKMCQIIQAYGITPIVRIPSPDPYLACQCIDGGAKGVIAPYLESVEQIRELAGATKLRPLKGEVLQKVLKGEQVLSAEMKAYLDNYNKGNICIANIESVPAMNKLDDLLSVPGLDGVFIGPHDLSISLGIPEQYDHPEFEKAVKHIIHTTRSKGLSIAIHFSLEPERQAKWVKEGVNIVVHSTDIALFSQKLNADISAIKKAVGDVTEGNTPAQEEVPVV